jgi:hypothetical protein
MPRLNQKRQSSLTHYYNSSSHPASLNNAKRLCEVHVLSNEPNMQQGVGLMDAFHSIYNKGRQVINQTVADIKNILPASDENARSAFAGENHAILMLQNKKPGIANFMGPGTHVIDRLKRGDVGRTYSDKVAKRHDIDYTLASTAENKEEQLKLVREADNRMINSLKNAKGKDNILNIQQGLRLIQAKKKGEDLGLLDRGKFAGQLKKLSNDDLKLLEDAKNKSEQDGFGLSLSGAGIMTAGSGKVLPGQRLKMKLLRKQLKQVENKKNGMKGRGIDINKLKSIGSDFAKNELPKLIEALGLKVPTNNLNKIVESSMNTQGTLNDKSKVLASNLLSLLAVKHVVGQSGKGLKLAGQGLENVADLLPNNLINTLSKGIENYYSKSLEISGGKMRGGAWWGSTKWWSDFGKGFVKGFKSVFKPGAKILGAIATAIGQPEIGVPLNVISDVL